MLTIIALLLVFGLDLSLWWLAPIAFLEFLCLDW